MEEQTKCEHKVIHYNPLSKALHCTKCGTGLLDLAGRYIKNTPEIVEVLL